MRVQLVMRRRLLLEFLLHRERRFTGGQPCAIADAKDMRIDRNGRFTKCNIEDDVRGLAAHARQLLKRLSIPRHFAAVLFNQEFAQGDDVLAFALNKPMVLT